MRAGIGLHGRLAALLLLLFGILGLSLVVEARRSAERDAAREIEAQLRATTDLLGIAHRRGLAGAAVRDLIAAQAVAGPIGTPAFEVLRGGEVLVGTTFPQLTERARPGLTRRTGPDGRWTVLTVVDVGDDITRRAAVSDSERTRRVAALHAARTRPLAIALPVFAIAVVASVWVGLAPLRRMRLAIARMDPQAPAPLGLPTGRMPAEVAELAEAFDHLLARLARRMDDQRIFASVASHELRTPLAAATSQLDVLVRDPDAAGARDRLRQSLRYLDRLVTQLLQLARDEAAVGDGPETFDLADLARAFDDAAVLDLPDRLEMTGHPDLIRALLRNLIENAVAAGGAAELRVSETAAGVEIVIADRGPGFPARRDDTFTPYARGGTAGRAGLGLAIVRRIAERHGGRVDLRDRPGGGAEVAVTLPRD